MANVKISALPAATSVAAADVLPIVQSATTKKATFQNVIDAVETLSPAVSFKNRIINGDFSVNQRGFSSTTTNLAYGLDRWRLVASDGTVTYSAQTFTIGNAITGQEPQNHARIVTSSQTLSSAEAALIQPIEDVRTFAGQQVTVSFWAKASSGTPKIALEFEQRFGSGGSPSGVVQTYGGQATISTAWARYSMTVTVPSISGKTIGTDANSSSLWTKFYVSAGSSLNSRTGSLGIQSNTFDIWGVQVEAGPNATAFERRPQQVELALCQRYWEQSYPFGTAVNTNTTSGLFVLTAGGDSLGRVQVNLFFRVPKRTSSYTMTFYRTQGGSSVWDAYWSGSNGTATPTSNYYNESMTVLFVGAAGQPAFGVAQVYGHWTCNAEL